MTQIRPFPLSHNLWQDATPTPHPDGTTTLHFSPVTRVPGTALRDGETPSVVDLSIPMVEIRASALDTQGSRAVGLWVYGESRAWVCVGEAVSPAPDALSVGRDLLEQYAASLQA